MVEKKKINFKEDFPLINPIFPGDNSYTYAQIENFIANYTITNVYDFNGIKIGETRYDAKITNLLGGTTITYIAITKINSYHGCHDIYIYFTGIRSYKIVSGGRVDLSYENTVVQNIVVDGKTYNSADYHAELDKDKKLIVTITYKKKNLCNNLINKYS
jgi:hypothetical protein